MEQLTTGKFLFTPQQPIGSGFDARSTAAEVMSGIDLSEQVAIVTGGNTGIGLETVKVLAAAGATVIVAARDLDKAHRNVNGLPRVELEAMDCMQPASIDRFAAKFLASGRRLHMLINNAGIMWVPLRRDERGIESQLATNYLGQYHLTARLWPALANAQGARVVNVSSLGHQFGNFCFEDPQFERREYETLAAYGQSKTASNLFTVALDARGKAVGIRSFAVHPGAIGGTELAREASTELFQQLGYVDADGNLTPETLARLKSIPQGAATSVWCATSPMLKNLGGVYCEDCDIALIDHSEGFAASGVKPYSIDRTNAERLWNCSEELTGIAFPL